MQRLLCTGQLASLSVQLLEKGEGRLGKTDRDTDRLKERQKESKRKILKYYKSVV